MEVFTSWEQCARSQLNLQNLWFVSHTLTLVGTLLFTYHSFVSSNVYLQERFYKVSTLGSLFTYLIVLYRCFFEEQLVEFNEEKSEVIVKTQNISFTEFIKNENAQLLGYILLWNFTEQSIFKLAPFFIYSFLNLTSFVTMELFPENSLSIAILPLLNFLEIPLLIVASHFDLLVSGVLVRECWRLKNSYPFIIYSFIWLLRFETSEASRSSIGSMLRFIDIQLDQEAVPDFIKEQWIKFRQHSEMITPLEFQTNPKTMKPKDAKKATHGSDDSTDKSLDS